MNALTFKRFGFVVAVLLAGVGEKSWGGTLTLTNPGEGSVTIPTGYDWTNVTVQCWGGGGGGGGVCDR